MIVFTNQRVFGFQTTATNANELASIIFCIVDMLKIRENTVFSQFYSPSKKFTRQKMF